MTESPTQSLLQVAHEHHERILHHLDQIPAIADALLTATAEDVRQSLHATGEFLSGILIPHVNAAEQALYPELERMLQNRHSMAPMRREHDEIRVLVSDFARLAEQIDTGRISIGKTLAVRSVMFQLYARLKIHLAEEEAYIRIVEHGVSADVAEILAAAMEHPGFRTP